VTDTPEPTSTKPPFLHVTTDRCPLRHCGWSGFHIHWRHRRHRSAFDGSMTERELDDFDTACRRIGDGHV